MRVIENKSLRSSIIVVKLSQVGNITQQSLSSIYFKYLFMQKKSPLAPPESRLGVRKIRIGEDDSGQRIDNFLRRELPGVPKSRLYRILRKGEVRVNGGRVRAEYKLQLEDEVRVPPVRVTSKDEMAPPAAQIARLENSIIFEDKRLLVINKPSGVAVHGGSGISFGVIELLRAARPDLKDISLVHRLDRETSGCLVLAKRRSALRELHEHFREGRVSKNYLALVIGDWQFGDYLVDAPLYVHNRQGGERHVVVDVRGKPASTRFRLSRTFGTYSLLQVETLTGRTHQIRVHALKMGHPLAGDERYGNEEDNAAAAKLGLNRLFLHAQSIAFADTSGNEQNFTAPLAEELEAFLERISGSRGFRTKPARRPRQNSGRPPPKKQGTRKFRE